MNTSRWIGTLALAALLGGVSAPFHAQPQESPERGDDAFAERHDADAEPRGWRGHRMNDDEIEAAYDIVVQLYPEVADRLEAQRDENPRELRNTLERKFPRVRFLVMLREHDPPMYELRMADIKLDRQTDALAAELREAREADDNGREDELMDRIELTVAEHFDVRQKIRTLEIEKLRQKLEELEQRLDDRDDDRKDLIEQRVQELVGPDW